MAHRGQHPSIAPSVAWVKTRKGRGYLTYDNTSHGVPHKMNSEKYWQLRKEFAARVRRALRQRRRSRPRRTRRPCAPSSRPTSRRSSTCCTATRPWSTTWPTAWSSWARACPREIPDLPPRAARATPSRTSASTTTATTRRTCTSRPAPRRANRTALAKWGAWVNSFGATEVRPPALPRLLGRPGRVHEHHRLRQGARRLRRLRLVRPRRLPRGRAAAAGDHRVRQRRHHGRPGQRQPVREPREERSTASGAPPPPTAPSPTCCTARCGSTASWPRTASSRSAR